MSLMKARTQRQEDGQSAGPDHTLLCRVHGCGKRWSVDISHGRVCSFHDETFSRAEAKRPVSLPPRRPGGLPVPIHEAVRPFSEPRDDEDPSTGEV